MTTALDIRQLLIENTLPLLKLKTTPELMSVLLPTPHEKIILGGWRASKSTSLALEMLVDIMMKLVEKKPALYWLVGPDYPQTGEEFRYLQEWSTLLGIFENASAPMEGPKTLWIKGGIEVTTKSGAHYERLGSVAPDMIGVCEAGQVSEYVRDMLIGRSMQKNARIIYAGTLEDDEGHAHWAWYQESAKDWAENPSPRKMAFSLPTWANPLFSSCIDFLREDPTLAEWCPDDNHPHGGENHPLILERKNAFDEYTFARRIAAIPTGIQFQVYPQLDSGTLLASPGAREWRNAYGGIDYGTTEGHPSSLVVVTVDGDGVAWVRECWAEEGGDTRNLQLAKRRMSSDYRCWNWATDPNERFMARSYEATAVSMSDGAREHRIGLVTSRLNRGGLRFDKEGPGVQALYDEMRHVHRRKQADGQLKLVRWADDRTAALEDAIELLDGRPKREIPTAIAVRHNTAKRVREYRRL